MLAIRRRNPAEADALLAEHFEIGANLREDAAAATRSGAAPSAPRNACPEAHDSPTAPRSSCSAA
jgi:hypothetical protein